MVAIGSVRAYRESLARALTRAGIDVVGTASDSVSALPCIGELEPDVVLLETLEPEQRWAVAGLKAAAPESRIVAFGVPDRPADALALVETGASGYVTSDQTVDEAAVVLRSVVRGELPCSGRVAAILAGRVSELAAAGPAGGPSPGGLTAREAEIAGLIAAGLSNKEIARMLCIELATVKNHVHNILAKLRVSRRSEVASKVPTSLPLWEADSARLTHQAPGSRRI